MWEFVCVVSIMQICLKLCLLSMPLAIIFVDWITDLLISEEEDIWWIFLQKFFLWLQFFFTSKFMADKRKCFIIYLNKKLFKSNSIKFYYLKMTFFKKTTTFLQHVFGDHKVIGKVFHIAMCRWKIVFVSHSHFLVSTHANVLILYQKAPSFS